MVAVIQTPPFKLDTQCPKCQNYAGPHWHEAGFQQGGCDYDDGDCPGPQGEHLQWRCQCGFSWATLTADHPETNASPKAEYAPTSRLRAVCGGDCDVVG